MANKRHHQLLLKHIKDRHHPQSHSLLRFVRRTLERGELPTWVKELKKLPNDVQHGEQRGYQSGPLSEEVEESELMETIRRDGTLYFEHNQFLGKMQGIARGYSTITGQLESSISFEDGLQQGDEIWYHNPTTILLVYPFKQNRKHGVCRLYFRDGQLNERETFKEGKREGEREGWKMLDGHRFPIERSHWVGDLAHGISETWFHSGVMESSYHHVMGRAEGEWRRWNQDGLLVDRRNFVHGNKHGLCEEFFSQTGIVSTRWHYEHGKMRMKEEYGPTGTLERRTHFTDEP